jgi:hypothetical protein
MARQKFLAPVVILIASTAAVAEEKAKDSISDYLVNVGAGHIAANELIGLTGSAVSNLQTPKDLVAALSGLGDPASKNGFGIAWSPGRSSMKLMAVSAAEYETSQLKRLWANTTFSYAQNAKTIGGANYGQRSAAINLVYYLGNDDPVLTQYQAFSGANNERGSCAAQSTAFDDAVRKLHEQKQERVKQRKKVLGLGANDPLPAAELDAIDRAFNELKAELTNDKERPLARVGNAKRQLQDTSTSEDYRAAVQDGLQKLDQCARAAAKKAADRWNASHIDVVLGQGWIRGDAAASPRISLGRHAGLALAWGHDDGLLNLTYRRVSGEVDLDTLTKALVYKGTSLAAARYTYRMDDRPGKQTYALAEISNAKASSGTTSNGAFKWAFGLDRQVGENMWIEVRAGRARVPGGSAEENKALLNLKFSPEAGLPGAIKASGS